MKKLIFKDYIAVGLLVSALITEFSKNIVAIPLISIWMILALKDNENQFKEFFCKCNKMNFAIYLWIFVSIILFIIGNKYMTAYGIKNIFRISCNLLIFGYYLYYEDKNKLKIFLYIALIIITLLSINTIINLKKYPNLSRLLSAANPEKYQGYVAIKFIGSFGFAYGLVFIITGLLTKKVKKTSEKIKLIILNAIFIITIIYEQFMISIILLIIAITFILFKCYNIKRMLITFLIFACIGLIIIPMITGILKAIAKKSNKKDLSERILEITNVLETGELDTTSDMNSRIYLDLISCNTFINDIFGVKKEKDVGGHSELLDEYAKYGIIIASITVNVFIQYMKFIRKDILKEKYSKEKWFIIEVVYLVYSIINTTMFIINCVMIFTIVPIILKISEGDEKNENSLDSKHNISISS